MDSIHRIKRNLPLYVELSYLKLPTVSEPGHTACMMTTRSFYRERLLDDDDTVLDSSWGALQRINNTVH